MRTPVKLLIPLAVFVAALALFASLNRAAGPREQAVARAPVAVLGAGASTDERIAALEASLRADPTTRGRGDERLSALGDAYLQRVREGGDATGYVKAQRAFDRALQRDPRDLAATIGLGTLALARHQFKASLILGERAVALAPEAAAPLPVVVDALVELGRYDDAERTLQRLVDRRPGLAAYARISYLRELRGDVRGAVAAMRLAVDAGSSTPEGAAYVQTLLGTLERNRGRLGPAVAAYRAALRAQPGFPAAGVGMAGVEASQGRADLARARLRRIVGRTPSPESALALAELELADGRSPESRAALALVSDQRSELRAGGENTDTEEAAFQADHGDPAEGVRLGRRAWAAAPSLRSADALGWALTRAGRPAEGYAWSRRALRRGWREPRVVYHAGMAALEAGRSRVGRRLLRSLLAQNPAFSPLYAPRARRALAGTR
ncbi:MAG: hypothetical protein AVDCRST_MAG53-3107 [uncultured Solirubrobacteraceae bacterium]|uniref:Tetratricopeptide repeat protein n=1 Tax=uncultured Solirubrobacteraceae bacterium TaxID=1162706 RepID=A0A6J4T933_9ACTN|nr:MAG: hypothetical protein AVDCRST_MAG53-3107 [uncultured Solirubrobacteraceae bacterium]